MKTEKKARLLNVTALFLLFATCWMFYQLTLNLIYDETLMIVELIFPFVFYCLFLYGVSPTINGLLAFVGVGVLFVVSFLLRYENQYDFFMILTYIPPMLSFVIQIDAAKGKKGGFFSVAGLTVARLFCVALTVVMLFSLFKSEKGFYTKNTIFFFFLFAVLWVVYFLVMRTSTAGALPSDKAAMKTMKHTFLFALCTLPQTMILSCVNSVTPISNTVPLLWILNLLFLYERHNPFVRGFVSHLQTKFNSFFPGED
ncbi:MAG: hypothetical protein IJU56_04530 [Clostridia bacterium]|nr:hypothetical protein [Clostridia bacterium]